MKISFCPAIFSCCLIFISICAINTQYTGRKRQAPNEGGSQFFTDADGQFFNVDPNENLPIEQVPNSQAPQFWGEPQPPPPPQYRRPQNQGILARIRDLFFGMVRYVTIPDPVQPRRIFGNYCEVI